MTRIYTRKSEQEKRRHLRKNMTKAEVLLWLQLKNKQILGQRFLRQYSVGPYVIDFYCPKLKLAIEVDGATHVTNEEKQYDSQRQQTIETLGIQFLRFTNLEIYGDMENGLEKIREKVRALEESCNQNPL